MIMSFYSSICELQEKTYTYPHVQEWEEVKAEDLTNTDRYGFIQ